MEFNASMILNDDGSDETTMFQPVKKVIYTNEDGNSVSGDVGVCSDNSSGIVIHNKYYYNPSDHININNDNNLKTYEENIPTTSNNMNSIDCQQQQQQTNVVDVEVENFADLCRVCANSDNHMIPIFEDEGVEHDLITKIHKHLPIKITETDTLPIRLCYHCASTVLAWNDLLEGCLNAEQRLLQMQEARLELEKQMEEAVLNAEHEKHQEHERFVVTDHENEEDKIAPDIPIQAMLPEIQLLQPKDINLEEMVEEEEEDEFLKNPDDPMDSNSERYNTERGESEVADFEVTAINENGEEVKILHFGEIADIYESDINHPDFRIFYCSNCNVIIQGYINHFEEHLKTHGININIDRMDELENIKLLPNNFHHNINIDFNNDIRIKQDPDDPDHFMEEEEEEEKNRTRDCACDACEKDFLHKTLLKQDPNAPLNTEKILEDERERFIRSKTKINNKVVFKCEECDKVFNTRPGFLRHIRIHAGNRPCVCTSCGKSFRIKQDLDRHIKDVHKGIKKYICDICQRPFANKYARDDHRRIHTGEKPYSCKYCFKNFRTLTAVYLHKRLHMSYECEFCRHIFSSKQRLNNHIIQQHTTAKPS